MKNYFGYEGKTCVVTGTSSGMGEAVAKMLVDLGAKVYAMDISPCTVEGVTAFYQMDLSKKEQIDEVFAKIPERIDSYFGVAGLSGSKTNFNTTFHVNYTSNVYITETYLKDRMGENGSIVYVTSTAGIAWKEQREEFAPILKSTGFEEVESTLGELIDPRTPSIMAYMLSKRCMNAYANKVACELGIRKIRVNAVLPGSTDTGMKEEFATMAGGIENMIKAAGLANRLATSEEMAQPIVFINSKMASFISGIDFVIDYADQAMKSLGIKAEMCNGPAILHFD